MIEARRAANRQSRETKASLDIAKRAADAAVSGRRPWIKVDVSQLDTPLEMKIENGTRAYVCVPLIMTNIGEMPATSVNPSIVALGISGKNGWNLKQFTTALVAELKHPINDGSGILLFPGNAPLTMGCAAGVQIDEIETAEDGTFTMPIRGAISYKWGNERGFTFFYGSISGGDGKRIDLEALKRFRAIHVQLRWCGMDNAV